MRRRDLVALTGAVLLTVLHTWPLASNPTGLSRLDNADTALTTWIVAWVAHALPRTPLQVFDAPMFHPERRTLAYSEPLLVPGAMAIPLRAAGVSAATTYNLLAMAGFALSAWAMWRLVTDWTGDPAAGAVAGMAFAFNAHLLTRFAHLQALHAEFVPLVLLAVDRVARQRRWRDGVLLGIAITLVGLVSIYQLAFVAGATVVALLARRCDWREAPVRALAVALFGIGLSLALLSPMLWQYLATSHEAGIVRSLEETARYGATWRDYLATGGRLHYALWSAHFFPLSAVLFPGVAVTVLALAGWLDPHANRGRVRMCVAVGVLGVAMSLGTALPFYEWLYRVVPLLQATRVTARWGVLALTALAMLAGFGVAALRRGASARRRIAVAALAPLLVTVEAMRTPMDFTPTPRIPAIYRQIAELPDAVLVEIPLFPGREFNLNAPYLLGQTEHFHPMIAGYSGFYTNGYAQRIAALTTFPAETAQASLRRLGVTHMVFHLAPLRQSYSEADIDALDRLPWLERVLADDTARVFRVKRELLAGAAAGR
ncbi:MAG TPA: hypothetical protein VMW48_00205 [Vicinamibacterales bacterium]|nr:hypothetical protein [Vicinamibacterales bacterium]